MYQNYILTNHQDDILRMLEDPDKEKYFSISINFLELFESDPNLGNALLTDPENSLKILNEAVFDVQNNLIQIIDKICSLKNNVTCRVHSLPPWPHVSRTVFPGNEDVDKFLQITGTIVRMSARKLLEYQRQYLCTKCKYPITVEAKLDRKYIIKAPKRCTNPEGCTGKNIVTFGELDPFNCKDYQEIKIQEDLSQMGVGSVPGHMVIILEDDLVNSCKPGENVTITGVVKRRWSEFEKGVKIIVDIVLKANHIQVNNSSGLALTVSDEMQQFFQEFWIKYEHNPLIGRNIILKSISPEIFGRHLVKLAIAIVLAGGSPNEEVKISTGIDTRAESHLLLVGDPGTGKSQMLKFASKIVPRSVLTTGVGSTAAGLTVTAIMENGEWQLEAGALVMADGGICCIDEFNSMREHDRTSIHEAMEQQTISVAKAGIVCKLKTRCSVLAACNPKGNLDPSQPLCVNVAMSSPLLSRFDLVLLLRDIVNEDNDRALADHLLNKNRDSSADDQFWSLEKLQAYYATIKKRTPKLTADAETILSTYYQLQRKFGSRNKSRTTVRLLESLIRLSQGHAKLIFHSKVQVVDTIFAIILADSALESESSLFNLSIDKCDIFDRPEQAYSKLVEVILQKLNLDHIYQREIERTNNTGESVEMTRTYSQTEQHSQFFSRSRRGKQTDGNCQNIGLRHQGNDNRESEFNFEEFVPKRPLFSQRRKEPDSSNFVSDEMSGIEEFVGSNVPKRPLLLFSQRRKEPDNANLVTDEISGYKDSEIPKSSAECLKIFNRDKANRNSDMFSIYQNKNDAFIRKKTFCNLENDSEMKNSENDSLKTLDQLEVERSKNQSTSIGKPGLKLSDIVKANSSMDWDFELDFINLKPNKIAPNTTNKSRSFQSANEEDSGIATQNIRENNRVEIKSTKNSLNGEKCGKTADACTKKTKKNEITNDMDLLKLMPSVNDDLNIDWELSDEIEKEPSQPRQEVENTSCHEQFKDTLTHKEPTLNKTSKQASNVKKPFADLMSKYEFVPRERREGSEIIKEKDDSTIIPKTTDEKIEFDNKNVLDGSTSFLENSNREVSNRSAPEVDTKIAKKFNFKKLSSGIVLDDLDEEL